jgi:enamine deaminase RidA (YjgF/YER057c/UK114 family)
VQHHNLLFIAGQLSQESAERRIVGKLGREVGIEEGKKAARLCALQVIAQLRNALAGDLDRVERSLRITGFVNAVPEFQDHPQVMNGASDLLVEIFGDAGRHTRTSVGVAALPFNVAVEIDAIFAVR